MNTPGPWLVKFGGMDGDEYFVIGSRDGDMICDSHPLLLKDRIPHDARLIAAAPALLSVLESIIDAHPDSVCEAHREMARDLIAEVRGES